ncbi:MAG: TetR/AcrR family transcriptional regulator [Methanobrevibacter sp.]|nr:TetR/AcrR family transcriptional regulator [Methanobrevibacter sp.]
MNKRDKISEATFALSLKEGFDNVSMKEIQKESGLSAGLIYYYFKDKDEILLYMFNKYVLGEVPLFKETIRNLDCSFIEKLRFIFTHKTTFFNENNSSSNASNAHKIGYENYFVLSMSIYHQYPEIRPMFHEMHNDLNDFYQELVQEAIEKEEIRDDIDVKTLVILIQSSLRGYLNLWMTQSEFSFGELVEANINMLWNSIKKR